jgi:hypothetical protein
MRALCVLLTLLLSSCAAGIPFEPTVPIATSAQVGVEQLVSTSWPESSRRYRIRQTVLFELRGAKVPMTGLMNLDTTRGSVRLVAVNDLGVKFFDLELDRKTQRLHYLLPELERFPGFDGVVAKAVRRIFLAPRPDGDESLQRSDNRYLLSDGTTSFEFGGAGPQLLAIERRSDDESWRLDFYEFRGRDGRMNPGGVILKDRKADYRLTIWFDEVTYRDT